jgi:asparagine synthase (glutamine-hydrolysing)
MCGIAGLFMPRGARVPDWDPAPVQAVMRHRGPDGERAFASPDKCFRAAFTRLAIIDLETGDQPIVAEGGARVLLCNGEIYNYRELRADEPDYPYRTQGDAEVVLPLATRWGEDFVHRLNGMYALALWQAEPHRLVLVRDRLGVKPLYWARLRGGGIAFASEIKALFAGGLVAPAVDETAVRAYVTHGYVPGPRTLFAGIEKLLPGHLLRADADGRIEIRRYWRAEPAADLPREKEEIGPYLTELLRDSVRLQLRSDVPVGALLSGGLDSGLMVALAADAAGGALNTYTVRFQGSAIDEAPLAAQVAERYATRHTCFDLPAADVADHLPLLAWHCEEPLNDAALLPNYLIERVLAGEVKVALNGTGGDELFAGYGRYFRLPVEARYLTLPAWLRQGLVEPVIGACLPMTAWRLRRAGKFDGDPGGYLSEHATHFPQPMLKLMDSNLAPVPPAQVVHAADFDGPRQSAALYADLNTYLVDDLLTLLDRTSMAVGVEGRVPFLDHRLVAAALAVPPEIRTPGGRQKALEREMAAPFLPDEVIRAPKQGFASPVPAWLAAGLAEPARRILTRPSTLERGWWSEAGIARLLARPRAHGFRIYSLLMLELAIRLFVEAPAGRPPSGGLEALAHAA